MLKKHLHNFNFWFFNYVSTFAMLGFFIVEPWRKTIESQPAITSTSSNVFYLSVLVLSISLFFYIKSYKNLKLIKVNKNNLKNYFLIFSFLLIFIWPISSNDTFSYIYQSRIISHHHENPYEHSYSEFKNDQLYKLLENKWSNRYSPYGPLFLNIGSAITKITNNNLIASLLLFKFIIWLFFIGSANLIYKITKSSSSFYLFAFNPYLLFEFLINGHNDIIVIFFLLLSIYYLFKTSWQSQSLALGFLFLAFLTKAYAIIFLPLAGLKIILNKKPINEKILTFLCLIIFAIPSTLISLFLIDKSMSIESMLSPIKHQSSILSSFLHSPSIGIIKNISQYSWKGSITISQAIFVVIYSALLLLMSLKSKYRKIFNLHVFIWLLAIIFFFLTCISWFMPWYLSIVITLLILMIKKSDFNIKQKIFLYSLYFISFFAILFYMILK